MKGLCDGVGGGEEKFALLGHDDCFVAIDIQHDALRSL